MRKNLLALRRTLPEDRRGGRLIPEDILALFGPPVLWPGEDPSRYEAMLSRIAAELQPTDIFGWLLVKDLVDQYWEIDRYQRCQITALQTSYDEIKSSKIAALEQEIENPPDRERRWGLEAKLDAIQGSSSRIAKLEQKIENTPERDWRRHLERMLDLKRRAQGYDALAEDGLKQQLTAWHTENNKRVAEITSKLEQARAHETTGSEFASIISSIIEQYEAITQMVAGANAQFARINAEIAKHAKSLARDLRGQVDTLRENKRLRGPLPPTSPRFKQVDPVRLNDLIELLGPPALLSYEDEDRYRKTLVRVIADLGRTDTIACMLAKRFVDESFAVARYRGLIAKLIGSAVEDELQAKIGKRTNIDNFALARFLVESTHTKNSLEKEQELKRIDREEAAQKPRVEEFERTPPTLDDITNALRRCLHDPGHLERLLRQAQRSLSATRAQIGWYHRECAGRLGKRRDEVIDAEVLPPAEARNRAELPQVRSVDGRRAGGTVGALPANRARSRTRGCASARPAKTGHQKARGAARK